MPQTLRGDVIRNDNIAIGFPCGAENAVARGVPGPVPANETVMLVPGRYRDQILADGASNYWRLNESSGLTAVDQIGGATGTISGGVTLNQPGALADGDTAMVFNGATGKIVMAAVLLPLVCTIEGWINVTASVDPIKHFWVSRGLAGAAGDAVNVGALGTSSMHLYAATTAATASGVLAVTAGQWHHTVYVMNGSTISFYLDGVFDQTSAFSRTSPSTGPGQFAFDPGVYAYLGSLDDVAIYPVALTPAQILAHYQLRLSGPVSPYGVEKIAVGVTGPNPEVP